MAASLEEGSVIVGAAGTIDFTASYAIFRPRAKIKIPIAIGQAIMLSWIMKNKVKVAGLVALFIAMGGILVSCSSYHYAYPPTPAGVFEEKLIPEAYVLETSADQAYSSSGNGMFKRLFNYINTNEIKMTVPVEADLGSASSAMRFFLSPEVSPDRLQSTDDVKVRRMPEKLVVSHGARGSYSISNVDDARVRLENWLKAQAAYRRAGDTYAIFWDSPFKLWFLKRFEIHMPVVRSPDAGEAPTK